MISNFILLLARGIKSDLQYQDRRNILFKVNIPAKEIKLLKETKKLSTEWNIKL